MRALSIVVAMLLTVSCSDDHESAVSTSSVPRFDATDCPVADEVFCATAAEVANALAARDADTLLALSRSDTIVCADMAIEYFPGCATQDELTGHGLSGPDLIVEVVTSSDYLEQLRAITDGLDSASLQILGVGTCGPNTPGQRTYHLSWTAMYSENTSAATTVVGSFELLFIDDWRIVLFYFGTLERWEAEPNDPFSESFCEAGGTQWLI